MNTSTTRTWAEIDLDALERNYFAVTSHLKPGAKLICVVKADAYGHGAVCVARRLEQAGADTFAVATPDEAFELRNAGITRPILILGVSPPQMARELAEHGFIQTVPDADYARELSVAMSGSDKPLVTHLKFDTGMGRLGMQNIADALAAVALPHLRFDGAYTHFASADEPGGETYTSAQYGRFMSAVNEIEAKSGVKFRVKHCSNSGGALGFPDYQLDYARVGLLLYGYSPFERVVGDTRVYSLPRGQYPPEEIVTQVELSPVMQLKTRVSQVKNMSAGDRISYGGVFTATRSGKAAVLPVGYADGLHRALSGKLEMLVRGKRVPQIGRICMDMCVLDVTDVPDVQPGDEVIAFGRSPAATAREAAELCGTIPYEILCAVSARVPRVTVSHRI